MKCRFCGKERLKEILDLGHQPPSNSFLTDKQLDEPEVYYPLKLFVCDSCWLVQIPETKKVADIFTEDYAYYSSESPANVSHAKEYCDMMMDRFGVKYVLEIGSNDGYLLQHFLKYDGVGVKGVDPAEGPALKAQEKGIVTDCAFFGSEYAENNKQCFDLICGINVLNHQADINDFVKGLKIALKPGGIITFEFPHLMPMVAYGQWDTIYHEHLNYYSLSVISRIFKKHDLYIFDVDELPEHGGSLRIYASDMELPLSDLCKEILDAEKPLIDKMVFYNLLPKSAELSFNTYTDIISDLRADGAKVMAYGAAAKANTLINFCRFTDKDIMAIADRSPYKVGKYLPGSHIPVVDPALIKAYKPDYIIITAWNLATEILTQLSYANEWGCTFIIFKDGEAIWSRTGKQ